MKRKPKAPRNPYVAAAKFRKAGLHGKSAKAMRRQEKVELTGCSSKVEHSAFNRAARIRFPPPRPVQSIYKSAQTFL